MNRMNIHAVMGVLIMGMLGAALCQGDAAATAKSDAPPATARGVIEEATREALAVLRDPKLSKQERSDKVRAVAYANMDFEVLARLALGRNWRDLTEAQQREFVPEFRKFAANTYSHISDQYTDQDINVGDDYAEPRGDWTVETRIIGTENGVRKQIAKVYYRLRKTNDRWLIIDITIDGVSLMSNFRAQFQDIMSNGGYDRLIKMIKDKNAAADQ